jgi:hypothetical protein
MVRYQFGEDLYRIKLGEPLGTAVYELIMWAEAQGRTAELIRGSQQWNPQSLAMQEFVGSLSKSTRQDEQTVPASPPRLSESLRQALLDALLLIPGMDDFEFRSKLLVGIPWQASLPRGWSDVRRDLETMIDQLGSLGQLNSGAWPLVILADNAQWYAAGTEAERPLVKIYKRFLTFYKGKAAYGSAERWNP